MLLNLLGYIFKSILGRVIILIFVLGLFINVVLLLSIRVGFIFFVKFFICLGMGVGGGWEVLVKLFLFLVL